MVEKLLARLKFQTELKNDRQDKNNMLPIFDLESRKTSEIQPTCLN